MGLFFTTYPAIKGHSAMKAGEVAAKVATIAPIVAHIAAKV
jgi:hypothetical protein